MSGRYVVKVAGYYFVCMTHGLPRWSIQQTEANVYSRKQAHAACAYMRRISPGGKPRVVRLIPKALRQLAQVVAARDALFASEGVNTSRAIMRCEGCQKELATRMVRDGVGAWYCDSCESPDTSDQKPEDTVDAEFVRWFNFEIKAAKRVLKR